MKKSREAYVLVPLAPSMHHQWLKLHPRSRIIMNDGALVTVRMSQPQYLAYRAGLLSAKSWMQTNSAACGCACATEQRTTWRTTAER